MTEPDVISCLHLNAATHTRRTQALALLAIGRIHRCVYVHVPLSVKVSAFRERISAFRTGRLTLSGCIGTLPRAPNVQMSYCLLLALQRRNLCISQASRAVV